MSDPALPPLDHARHMRRAIEQARQVPELPFGAVIVDAGSGTVGPGTSPEASKTVPLDV